LQDLTNTANLFTASSTTLRSVKHHDFDAGIDVTGAITATTNITATGNIVASGHLQISNDTGKLKLGASQDLQLYHDSTHSYITNDTGTLRVRGDDIRLQNKNGETFIKNTSDSSVELYFDNSKKFETDSNGVTVIGTLRTDQFRLGDGEFGYFGNDLDLQIYHDGSNSIIDNNTGDLIIRGDADDVKILAEDDILLRDNDDSTNFIHCINGGAVELYFNGTKRFNTTATGATITGVCNTTTLNCTSSGSTGANFTVGGDATISGGQLTLGAADSASAHINSFEVMTFNIDSDNDDTNRYFAFYKNGNAGSGTELVRITEDGNVGIGTTDPSSAKLQIHGTGTPHSQLLRLVNTQHDTNADSAAQLKFGITNSLGERNCRIEAKEEGGNVNAVALDFYTNSSSSTDGETRKMRIDSSGRVLIGTTTEGHAGADNLTINDSGNVGITLRSGTSNNGAIFFSDATSGDAEFDGFVQYNHGADPFMQFGVADDTVMVLKGSSVGIGTASPTVTLDIESASPVIKLTDSDATGTPECEISGAGGDLILSADKDGEKDGSKIFFKIDGNTDVTIDHDGNVDIGGNLNIPNDTGKLQLGASQDVQLFHDGGNTHFSNTTGTFKIKGDDIHLQNASGSEDYITTAVNGAAELYFDNSKKLQTNPNGVHFSSAHTFMDDNFRARFGAEDDLQIYHDGSNSFIDDTGTGQLRLRSNQLLIQNAAGNANQIICTESGAVDLHHDGSKKLETTSTGVAVTGDINLTANIDMVDSTSSSVGRIRLGTDDDYQLYHDGNHNIIKGLQSLLLKKNDAESYIRCIADAQVELHFDGSKKLETTSTGAYVQGNLGIGTTTARDKLEIKGDNAGYSFRVNAEAQIVKLLSSDNTGSTAGGFRFCADNGSTEVERMRIDTNGGVYFGVTSTPNGTSVGGAAFIPESFNRNTLYLATTANTKSLARFHNENGQVGVITVSGSSTAYTTSSDYRLKENITAISDAITRLKTLKPYRFNFKADASTTVDGFLAHEVTAVPEAITGTKDEVDADNKPVYQGIDQSKLVPLLVAAVQELTAKVEALEAA